jgi:hypothetical protein
MELVRALALWFVVSVVSHFFVSLACLLSFVLFLQGIFWRFELHRGGQKLIIPVRIFSLSLIFAYFSSG